MVEKIESSIYETVYRMLKERGISEIFPYEFYTMVENIRFTNNHNNVINKIRKELLQIGLIDRQIDRMICYMRFSRYDSRLIEQEMVKRGMIRRVGLNRIVVL